MNSWVCTSGSDEICYIIPILKNRQGDTSDKNNYRPIAIVTALSKIVELCLMNLIELQLDTSNNQFGFKNYFV